MTFNKTSNQFIGPAARSEVEMMNPYSAPLEGRRDLLRLDFNENTLGPSPKVIKALNQIPQNQISIYPEYDGLREALIKNLLSRKQIIELKTNQIGIFNGVDAAIHAIFHAYGDRGSKVLTTDPTFGYYKPCAQMQGMKTIAIPYKEKSFEFPVAKIKEKLINETPKILLICNPNNPTGTRLESLKIIDLALSSPKTLVVIDELYEAFTGDSLLPIVNFSKIPNIVILRSLSKTAGLAGLRIGFALGNNQLINRICRVTGPYDVNSFAVTAAMAALKDQEYTDQYVKEVLAAKEWIQHKLIENKIKHHIAGGNYFLLWPKYGAKEVYLSLKKLGILTRPMSNKSLLEGSIRVSIGTIKQMEHFWNIYNNL